MGLWSSKPAQEKEGIKINTRQYKTLEEVQTAMRQAGLESSNIIFAIDYTKSNLWTGKQTFGGKCLHALSGVLNPYQQVIAMCARSLEPFDDDKLFPVYGFGDVTTTDKAVFPFYPDNHPCDGVSDALRRYTEITPSVQMLGPTSFAPAIDRAIQIVQQTGQYHILIIIADGQVTSTQATVDAIVRASGYALSIVVVGVGDGPWDAMIEFDEGLPQRKFDNFHFVDFYSIMSNPRIENYDVEFAVQALMEIPPQYVQIRKLGLM
eukprot:TRINITY_DN15875_c0_g1_i1.p1 TRINITY_DN15875_c0_g1~~TRINITY_DN15875_c0_g1_i1.p1  ORF type:complete len:264 (-),score=55.72 TRINITY_DN15875_c0_g1_i1:49-840(-)